MRTDRLTEVCAIINDYFTVELDLTTYKYLKYGSCLLLQQLIANDWVAFTGSSSNPPAVGVIVVVVVVVVGAAKTGYKLSTPKA